MNSLVRVRTCLFASIFTAVLLALFAGIPALALADPPIPANTIRVHYFRPDGNYFGWTIYAFGEHDRAKQLRCRTRRCNRAG